MKYKREILVLSAIVIVVAIGYFLDRAINDKSYQLGRIQEHVTSHVIQQKSTLDWLEAELSERSDPFQVETDIEGSLRVYDNGNLIYWNDNRPIPAYSILKNTDTVYVVRSDNNSYLVSKKMVRYNQKSLMEYFAVTPLLINYPLSNQYLSDTWNPSIFENFKVRFSDHKNVFFSNQALFGISIDSSQGTSDRNIVNSLFFIFCLLLGAILFVPNSYLIVIFTSSLVLFRIIKLSVFPMLSFIPTSLNDSTIYYDSWWLPSLADLLVNQLILLICVYHLFRFLHQKLKISDRISRLRPYVKWPVLLVTTALLLGNYKLFFDLIWSLNSNTIYSADVGMKIDFSLSGYSLYLSILIQSAILLVGNHVLILILKSNAKVSTLAVMLLIIGVLSWFLIPEFVLINWSISAALIMAIHLLSSYLSLEKFRYQSLTYLALIGLSLSCLIAYANYEYAEKTIKLQKEKFASSILIGHDVLGEYYINELSTKIKSDLFIRSRFLNQLLAQQNIKTRIQTQIPIYLDKYEIGIHTYDFAGAPYGLTENTDLDYWRHNYAIPANETGYEGIYNVDVLSGKRKYVSILPISFYEKPLGYIVLELTQKKFVNNSIFPALLVEKNPFAPSREFEYAIFKNGELTYSQGSFEFERKLNPEIIDDILVSDKEEELNGDHFLAKRLTDGSVLVIVSEVYAWIEVLANISFYLLVYLVLAAIVYSMYRFYSDEYGFSLSNKIQFYIGASFLLPMLLIILSLLQVLNSSYLEKLTNDYKRTARSLAEQIAPSTRQFEENNINRDQYFFNLRQAADFSQNDLIVYDEKGRLLGTNRNEVFNLNLLDEKINPQAIKSIASDKSQLVVLDENVGNLSYKNVYTVIYDTQSGSRLGILSIPFFNFRSELDQQQKAIFQNLIILISSILILTLIVSQLSLRRIIQPIKTIASRLKGTSYLNDISPILTYHSKDEIGQLVDEYNLMVSKLAESKKELLEIQKESAWKEIAKQVAHEIKNPLTPMRLKIQQLQRHFEEGSRQHQNLESLFAQVDSLAMIADSFSAFAKMPAPQNIEFNLSSVLSQAAALFQSDEVSISMKIEENIKVYTDPKLLSQIFNNLILNAIQSYEDAEKKIGISLTIDQNKAVVSIKDWGNGIAEDSKEKIFKPYFSTKETGSGIGLALAKKGIEQADGAIWFESDEGKGTTFFVSLPLSSI